MNLGGGDDWDDSELIKAYDKAVKNWRKSKSSEDGGSSAAEPTNNETAGIGPWVSVKKEDVNSSMLAVSSWILGSPCRAVWSQDGLEYEAKIVGIVEPHCTIRFVGYGNQESKDLSDLKETFGKRSRDRQRREAQAANSQYLTVSGTVRPGIDGEDYFSSVSLTSSMCNNCPSIANGGHGDDDQLTTTTDFSGIGGGQRESVSSSVFQSPRRKGSPVNKRKRDAADAMSVDVDPDTQGLESGRIEDALPSGAEATLGSSSSSSNISEDDNEDGDDEATSAPGGFGEAFKVGFPSMVPQFPVPPMPMSLADAKGKFNFGRGQLPSLLLSWYMSGYHSGYFDAQQAKKSLGKEDPSKSRSNKRQQ